MLRIKDLFGGCSDLFTILQQMVVSVPNDIQIGSATLTQYTGDR